MTAWTQQPPGLPHEVAELVLIFAIRAIDPFDPRKRNLDSAAIHALLTALPSATATTRAALLQMWWVDLDLTSTRNCVPLLDVMLAMSRPPMVRPLQYSQAGLLDAVKLCHLDVLEWWYTQRQCMVMYFNDVEWKDVIAGVRHAKSESSALWLVNWAIRTLLKVNPDTLSTAIALPEPEYLNATILTESMARGFPSVAQLVVRVWTVASDYRYSDVLQFVAENKDEPMITWALANLPWDARDSPGYHVLMGAVKTGDKCWIRRVMESHEVSSTTTLQSLPGASEAGQLDVIEWILGDEEMNGGLDAQGKLPPYTQINMDKIALVGHVHVLEWWVANGERLGAWLVSHEHGRQCIVPELAKMGDMRLVKWWLEQTLFAVRPTTIKNLPVIAAEHGLVELLDYCRDTAAIAKKVTFATSALTLASKNGHLSVLQWWKSNKKRLACAEDTLELATKHGQLAVLDWWFDESGCKKLQFDERVLARALQFGQLDALEWWLSKSVLNESQLQQALESIVSSDWSESPYHPSVIQYLIHHEHVELAPLEDARTAYNAVQSAMGQPISLHFVHKHLAYHPKHTCRLLNTLAVLPYVAHNGTICTLQWMLAILGHKSSHFPRSHTIHLKRVLWKRDDSKATFRWLIDNEIPFDAAAVVDNGPGSPYEQIEKWLVDEVRKHAEARKQQGGL